MSLEKLKTMLFDRLNAITEATRSRPKIKLIPVDEKTKVNKLKRMSLDKTGQEKIP